MSDLVQNDVDCLAHYKNTDIKCVAYYADVEHEL